MGMGWCVGRLTLSSWSTFTWRSGSPIASTRAVTVGRPSLSSVSSEMWLQILEAAATLQGQSRLNKGGIPGQLLCMFIHQAVVRDRHNGDTVI